MKDADRESEVGRKNIALKAWDKLKSLVPVPLQILIFVAFIPATALFSFLWGVYVFVESIFSFAIRSLFFSSGKSTAPDVISRVLTSLLAIYLITNDEHVNYAAHNFSDLVLGYLYYTYLLVCMLVVYFCIIFFFGWAINRVAESDLGRMILFGFIFFVFFLALSSMDDGGRDCWLTIGRSGLVCE